MLSDNGLWFPPNCKHSESRVANHFCSQTSYISHSKYEGPRIYLCTQSKARVTFLITGVKGFLSRLDGYITQ